VVYIPEAKRLNVLLREFRVSRNHMAIVVNEYGSVAGLVTIEDVLEQIVGDIEDEYDFDEGDDAIIAEDDGRYRVKALTAIPQFNDAFGTHYSDESFNTIGGLVTDHFGRVPRRGDAVELDDMRFEVLRADARQVHLFLVNRVPKTVVREFLETDAHQTST
jgi:magnesium and cobalt transporter